MILILLQIPAAIELWLEVNEDAMLLGSGRKSRKLLNAEKIMFKTGPYGGIVVEGEEVSIVILCFSLCVID